VLRSQWKRPHARTMVDFGYRAESPKASVNAGGREITGAQHGLRAERLMRDKAAQNLAPTGLSHSLIRLVLSSAHPQPVVP